MADLQRRGSGDKLNLGVCVLDLCCLPASASSFWKSHATDPKKKGNAQPVTQRAFAQKGLRAPSHNLVGLLLLHSLLAQWSRILQRWAAALPRQQKNFFFTPSIVDEWPFTFLRRLVILLFILISILKLIFYSGFFLFLVFFILIWILLFADRRA